MFLDRVLIFLIYMFEGNRCGFCTSCREHSSIWNKLNKSACKRTTPSPSNSPPSAGDYVRTSTSASFVAKSISQKTSAPLTWNSWNSVELCGSLQCTAKLRPDPPAQARSKQQQHDCAASFGCAVPALRSVQRLALASTQTSATEICQKVHRLRAPRGPLPLGAASRAFHATLLPQLERVTPVTRGKLLGLQRRLRT